MQGLPRLDFMKIDIEGGEIDCLRGALATIKRDRPVISVEYGAPAYSVYGHSKRTLFDFAKENDYLLCDLYLNSLSAPADWELACDSNYWDFFLVPQERASKFRLQLMRHAAARNLGRAVRSMATGKVEDG